VSFSDNPIYIGGESLTDIDNDGDLDYAIGQRTGHRRGHGLVRELRNGPVGAPSVGTGHKTTAGAARWT